MAREEKDRDIQRAKPDKKYIVIVVDMEQVSPVPKQMQVIFFMYRNSPVTTLAYMISDHEGYCYRWDEGKSIRGTNETGSCLKHFLNELVSSEVNEVALWADSCGGQNRSQLI